MADNNNVLIGEHPIVKRFLKGIFNQKPSLPQYSEVWDVSLVLKWMKNIDLNGICLKKLSWKTVMLLALLSGQRIQTLKSFSIDGLQITDTTIFRIQTLLKQTRPGYHLPSVSFSKKIETCVLLRI